MVVHYHPYQQRQHYHHYNYRHIITIIATALLSSSQPLSSWYFVACTIYCQEITNNSGDSYMKDHLDPSTVLDIIKKMRLDSIVMKVKVIDEVMIYNDDYDDGNDGE